jgi:hypothetical protein
MAHAADDDRVATLERALRRQRIALFGLAVLVLGCSAALVPVWLDRLKGHVASGEFRIVDPEGRRTGSFHAWDGGIPVLHMGGRESLLRTGISPGSVTLLDQDRGWRASLEIDRNGQPDALGDVPAKLGFFGRSELTFFDRANRARLRMGLDPRGAPFLEILGTRGEILFSAP